MMENRSTERRGGRKEQINFPIEADRQHMRRLLPAASSLMTRLLLKVGHFLNNLPHFMRNLV